MNTYAKIIACGTLVVFFVSPLSLAREARILNDHELDQVHAGGLNLDFEKFLGSFSSTSDTVSKGGILDNAAGLNRPIVFENNGEKIQIVGIKAPTPPKMPKIPTAPILQAQAKALGAPDALNSSSGTTPVPSVNLISAEPTMSPVTVLPSAVNSPEPEVVSGDGYANVPLEAATAASSLPDGGAVVLSTPVEPAAPTAPTAPVAATDPAMRFDVVAGQNDGKFAVAVSDQSAGAAAGVPFFTAASPGAQNYLNVTDTAQQNLEALVNVNAAGSVVPIQLNLTVLINSRVESLNLSNQLDLNQFSTYQF